MAQRKVRRGLPEGVHQHRRCEAFTGVLFGFYNERRRHQALDKQTPDEVYYRATYAMVA